MKNKVIGFRVDSPMLKRLKKEAKKNKRTLSNFIVWVLEIFMKGEK